MKVSKVVRVRKLSVESYRLLISLGFTVIFV